MKKICCLWMILLATWACTAAQPLAPSDKHLRYVGRFDWSDTAGPRCAWSGSTVEVDFSGTELYARVKDTAPADYLEIVVDGAATSVLQVKPDRDRYLVVGDLPPGRHSVQLVKRTEPLVGTVQYLGFETDGTVRPASHPSDRRVEMVGDSITCGFGDESHGEKDDFAPATENNTLAYGALAARKVGADYTCIAWSGRTMAPDNTMPQVYDRTLPADDKSQWRFGGPAPQAVVINLGTNDFRKGAPDQAMWVSAYCDFVRHLRTHYPKAHVYCCIGSMMTDRWPPGQHQLATVRVYVQDVVQHLHTQGDRNVSFLEFTEQSPSDGYGAAYHPSLTTHQKMAATLVNAFHTDLGW